MHIAVVGAGAIGSVLIGMLARAGEDVTLVGRPPHVDAVNRNGLLIDGVLGTITVRIKAHERLDFKPDLALLTAKTQDVEAAARDIKASVPGVPVVPLQNGVRRGDLLAGVLGKEMVLSRVVLFGATFLEPAT